MRRWHAHVRSRLSARFCRIFANAIRQEAMRRKNGYQVGPFRGARQSLEGWFEVANWLDGQAAQYENSANKKREPKF